MTKSQHRFVTEITSIFLDAFAQQYVDGESSFRIAFSSIRTKSVIRVVSSMVLCFFKSRYHQFDRLSLTLADLKYD